MNFERFLSTIRKNIRRTPYQAMAASMVMFMTFLVIAVFSTIAFSIQLMINHYESRPQVIAFFKDGTSVEDVDNIQNALQQTGKVTSLKYINKEAAFEIYKERNKDNPKLVELVSANVLPTSLEISTINLAELGPVADIVKQEPVVEEVLYPEDVVENLTKASQAVRAIGIVVGGFSLLFTLLSILMIIGFKVRIQRNEIETMKLLGASKLFIRLPYIGEGITYGLVGVVLSWAITYGVLWYFSPMFQTQLGEIQIFPISPLLMLGLLGVELLIAIIVGGIGSYAAVRRYLKF